MADRHSLPPQTLEYAPRPGDQEIRAQTARADVSVRGAREMKGEG
jgi:hypothetical protein